MKVRWVEHEFTLVTIVGFVTLAGYLWNIPHLKQLLHEMSYVQPGKPRILSLFSNALLPDLGMGILFYLSYIFLNRYIIRRLMFAGNRAGSFSAPPASGKLSRIMKTPVFRTTAWAVFLVLLLILVLGICLNLANYAEHRWNYDYLKFPLIPEHEDPSQIDILRNFEFDILITLLYILYAWLRETLIRHIEKNTPGKAFRTMVTNNFTAFMVAYLALIPVATGIFHINPTGPTIGGYIYLLLCTLTVFVNVFLIFPSNTDKSIFRLEILLRLFLLTLFATLPAFPFFESGIRLRVFFFLWAFQLIVVTPLSWLLYQQMQDKMLRLRGLESKLARSEADLQFLRSQINPHFLFNTLNTLYGMAMREGVSNLAEGIQKLGDMMRFMVHENNREFIPMDMEIEYLRNYISLQKLRIASTGDIIIEDSIDQKHCDHSIAPMLLIPFVENAFKYGISLKQRSWIKVRLECDEKYVHFRVSNSVHQTERNDDQSITSGIGIKNTEQRLKLLYPGKHEFSIRSEPDQFVIDLSIEF